MRRVGIIGLLIAFIGATLAFAAPAQAHNVGNEACTPGYWKNHTDNWYEGIDENGNFINPISTSRTVGQVGLVPAGHSKYDVTFLEALNYGGGSGVDGAEKILLRAAVAAFLNAAHEGLGYPLRRSEFVPMVYAAINSGDRATMLSLATYLDDINNFSEGGCPLN